MTYLIRMAIAVFVLAAPFSAQVARAQDASEIIVRLGRIEAENRRLNGRVEELEQQVRRLEDQMKRFQEDVEFRLGGGKPGAAPIVGAPPRVATPGAPPRRGDAFDPAATPGAPGAPRPLGATPPSAPLPPSGQPPRLAAGARPGAPIALPGAPGATPAAPAVATPNLAVNPPSGDARADFDIALGFMQRNEYEGAEIAFKQFIEAHPTSALRGSATYWLGESYFRRNMHREAAEQFLKVSTDFSKSASAPQGMLRLGQSLGALGARDQACATLREIDKRYPTSSPAFKKDVEREAKKAKCEAA